MDGDSRDIAVHISEGSFRRTRQKLCLREIPQCNATLASLVGIRSNKNRPMESYDAATIRGHLEAIPTSGDIRIGFTIDRSRADTLMQAKDPLLHS